MMHSAACASEVCFPPSRYTGKERGSESGNDHFGARYYGGWPTLDPSTNLG
jgi:hypothetical protein